jgi:hypothetical protein
MALVFGLGATAWEASAARRERGIALRERAEALSQKTLADSQAAIAGQERQAAQRSSTRAEKQAEEAERQKSEADRQKAEAEQRLRENQELAHSILMLDDAVQKASELDLAKSRLEALAKILREDTASPDITRRLQAATESVAQYTRASGAQFPTGWFNSSADPNYVIGVDQKTFHSGKTSAFIQCTKPPAQNVAGGLGQGFVANNYAGKRVRLTAFMKLQDVRDSASLWLRADSSPPIASLAFVTSFDKPKGNIDWHLEQLVMDIPARASAIYFGAWLRGLGEVWLDDFALQIVDNSVAVTEGGITPQFEPVNLHLEATAHK